MVLTVSNEAIKTLLNKEQRLYSIGRAAHSKSTLLNVDTTDEQYVGDNMPIVNNQQ